VLHVGDDAQLDVAGAHAAGLRSAWINRNGSAWAGTAPPHISVRSLHELADCLLQPSASPASIPALA
jgi:putative hydrolase of the HAD superfamily